MKTLWGKCARASVLLALMLAACTKSDNKVSADAAVDAPGNNTPFVAPPTDDVDDAIVDGTSPMDAPILAVLSVLEEDVTVDNAATHENQRHQAMLALVGAGTAAADRLAASCRDVSVEHEARTTQCHLLMGMVESAASTTLLTERAATAVQAWPSDAHPMGARPEVTARLTAVAALSAHAHAGSTMATDALTQLASNADETVREAASSALLRSIPRREAKRRLQQALPANEAWRIYEVRP